MTPGRHDPANRPAGIDLVAVGSSWGGLAAGGLLLESLPEDFDAPIVIVQHRTEAPSALAELLGSHTRLAVVEPGDKEQVRPGHVYLAPPGYHLLLDRNRFFLDTEAPVRYSRPSIDVLFQSAAEAFGRRMAAVVLTGANNDGSAGLALVAAAGGLAMVQDPATAERPTMPAAALAAVPDAVVGAIPELARALATAAAPRATR